MFYFQQASSDFQDTRAFYLRSTLQPPQVQTVQKLSPPVQMHVSIPQALVTPGLTGVYRLSVGNKKWQTCTDDSKYQGCRPLNEVVELKCSCIFYFRGDRL